LESFFCRAASQAAQRFSPAPASVDLFPENLPGTITGTYRVRDGALKSANLNLTIGSQDDFIFGGTVSR